MGKDNCEGKIVVLKKQHAAETKMLRSDLKDAMRYDVHALLKCPECGSSDLALRGAFTKSWICGRCHRKSPYDVSPLAALLAWHKVTP